MRIIEMSSFIYALMGFWPSPRSKPSVLIPLREQAFEELPEPSGKSSSRCPILSRKRADGSFLQASMGFKQKQASTVAMPQERSAAQEA